MNTLTLKDLPDDLASSGNSLLSMVMQLSMSIGVTIAGLLLGCTASSISASTPPAPIRSFSIPI
jgi:DHA2 family multidrug resistance protein-like MFS transporter